MVKPKSIWSRTEFLAILVLVTFRQRKELSMFVLLLALIYLSFVSLGLPDALLGSAWPMIYPDFGVPVSYAGIITMLISFCTVISSLASDRLIRKFGVGLINAASVGLTALAILGFSYSFNFTMLCLWAIPYGLGAGSIDAALNNYVALHYSNKHMNWLHCMWGVGTSIGPLIMGFAISLKGSWTLGYRFIFIIQAILTIVLFSCLPLWKKVDRLRAERGDLAVNPTKGKALSLKQILALPKAKSIMVCFFCYCGIEQTALLWTASYLVLARGISAEQAASFASIFCLGITVGRAISGFLAIKFSDKQMVWLGQSIILLGLIFLIIPFSQILALAAFVLIGLGCAPIYPSLLHSTPDHFGSDLSQAIIGVQMASAYVGSSLMPLLFGLVANHINIKLLPFFLLSLLIGMVFLYKRLVKQDSPLTAGQP